MSTTTSSASPTAVRSHSSSRNQTSYSPPSANQPTRTQSTTTKPTSSSRHSHRSGSRSYPHDAPPTANQAALANVARRDFETANVARPSSSRRSSSRDGQPEYPSETSQSHHRTSSRPGSARNSTDLSNAPTMVPNGGSTPVQPTASTIPSDRQATSTHPAVGRRRTSITTTTGTWLLGKTIGQGSMGKVKLAKNIETGEQVSLHTLPPPSGTLLTDLSRWR